MDKGLRKKAIIEFGATMLVVLALFVVSVMKTNAYNRAKHIVEFSGPALFSAEAAPEAEVSVKAIPRGSTWGKVFDFHNETSTEFYGG